MKKVLLVVALLLLATPVFAADVNVTATLVGAPVGRIQKVNIGYNGAAEANSIRAFAISVKLDNAAPDANLQNIGDFNRGESTKANGGYGIFPARFRQYITPLNGSQVTSTGGYGWADANYTPLAVWGDANAGWGNNTKWIVTELGTLYSGEANAPGKSGTLFTIDVNGTGDCNLCLELDQTRGGVVKNDTTGATVGLPLGGSGAPAGCIKVVFTAPDCFPSGDPNYTNWVSVGKPASWCGSNWRQCHGDADNASQLVGKATYWVSTNDLAVLTAGWQKAYTNPTLQAWISADFDHKGQLVGKATYRVSTNDLAILTQYWQKATVPNDCPHN